jgi:acetoacetate decarboxylase
MSWDNFSATVSGREMSAYPKALGAPRVRVEQGALLGTLDVTSERVATATMGYEYRELDADEARRQIAVPTSMLKVVRGYGARPMVCDLVRTENTDVAVTMAWTGPARLQLNAHVLASLADLPVLEIVDVSQVLTDLTLAGVKPVHDHLEAAQ